MNNRERELWVRNDEGLYSTYIQWIRRNKGGMHGFLAEHRDMIDRVIQRALDKEPSR